MANRLKRPRTPATLEGAATESFPYLVDALGISALGLLVPTSMSLGVRFGVQLALLVALGFFLALRLLGTTDVLWFESTQLKLESRIMATGLGLIVIVTGIVGLVTLASSAALRLQPSTQFLQLLSALDIAWASATAMVASYWLWGKRAAILAGAGVGVVCLASIGRYLDAVGFTTRGRWRLSAGDLWKYVLPFDIAVAALAIVLFVVASRRRARSGN